MALTVPYTGLDGVKFTRADIRAGYLAHEGTFKGNVIFFQGLADSMLNHAPLFNKITKAGYRVIAFDYMGQGGSTGKMNKTRIEYIPWIGERVWNKFALNTNEFPLKTIIGWSTGGLAAYVSAIEHKADKVILIAPGIAPRKIVGEAYEITLESLTTDVYFDRQSNPHRDAIKPTSPLKVPAFSVDLILTSEKMKNKPVSNAVKGFVLLSGEDDTYVNAERTHRILEKSAPHFQVKAYAGALHEIDNERKEIRESAHRDILNFLKSSR
jgi:alpha-beta hydrolase superfamily lysophospholipase